MINVYFGDYASYNDWGLVLEDCSIPPAEPKTNFVDIPGGDGTIDLTEAFGEVKYNDRELSFTFSVRRSGFEALKRTIANAIHGRRMRIRFSEDAGYYFVGRVIINEYETSEAFGRITINAMVEPYKYHGEAVTKVVTIPGTGTATNSGAKSVIPTISADIACKVTVNGVEADLPAGNSRIVELVLNPGSNSISVAGTRSYLERPYYFETKWGNPYYLPSATTDNYLRLTANSDNSVSVETKRSGIMSFSKFIVVEGLPAGRYVLKAMPDTVGLGYSVTYSGASGDVNATDGYSDTEVHNDIDMNIVEGGSLIIGLFVDSTNDEVMNYSITPNLIYYGAKVSFTYTERDL